MFYIPKIGDYLKLFTDEELKEFVAISFSKYFKAAIEKLYSKLKEEQNLRKFAESFYIFLTTPDEGGKYVEIMQSNMYIARILKFSIFLIQNYD